MVGKSIQFVNCLNNGLDAVNDAADADTQHPIVNALETHHQAVALGRIVDLEILRFQDRVRLQHLDRDFRLPGCFEWDL